MSDRRPRLDPPDAVPAASGPADDDTPTFVVCVIDDEVYALPVENVRKVLPLPAVTRVPTDAPYVVGVFQHSGQVLPLWDLHTLLAADAPPPERPFVLVLETEGRLFGVAVEDVDEVVQLPGAVVRPFERAPRFPIDQVVGGMLIVEDADAAEDLEGDEPVPSAADPLFSATMRAALETGRPRLMPTIVPGWAARLIDVPRLFALGTGRPAPADPEVRRRGS